MARKTFISYKYSEAQDLRDSILESLGKDASYYQGETSDSPDISDTTTENIKRHLSDMIHGTSVTVVIISPEMTQSKWVDWEIAYSLKEITREDQTSRTNGVVGVIMKVDESYDWIISKKRNADGCSSRTIDSSKLYDIINNNRFNRNGDEGLTCDTCKTYSSLDGSYISLIEEESFLADPNRYIDNAFEKSQKVDDFKLSKLV